MEHSYTSEDGTSGIWWDTEPHSFCDWWWDPGVPMLYVRHGHLTRRWKPGVFHLMEDVIRELPEIALDIAKQLHRESQQQ